MLKFIFDRADERFNFMRNLEQHFGGQKVDLPSVFAFYVSTTPNKTAIVETSGVKRTYNDLDIYSDKIATAIYKKGLPKNRRIGICIARSYDTVATALACVKLGCTYVPLAHDFPSSRLHDVCKNANVQFLIANESVLSKLPTVDTMMNIDQEREFIIATQDLKYIKDTKQEQAVNIIFTSGTISSPKGVLISQQGIINLVSDQNYAEITPEDVLLQISPFEFDGATLEMWGTLLNGATLILMPPGYPVLSVIAEKIETYGISLLFITTQLFNLMVDHRLSALDKIKKILTGGEKASAKHMRKFLEERSQNRTLSNIYGPAECTTFSTYYPIKSIQQLLEYDNVPIGKPIKGAYAIIVDENLEPVEKNVAGELLIGGKGVSQGYVDAPEKTKEKFIKKNYEGIPVTFFYRTGDKVFQNDEEDIVFMGRYDKELKIRGYRILPEEIEWVAMKYPNIASAALLVSGKDTKDKYTELYITTNEGSFSEKDFKEFLKNELPGYMHINRIKILDVMPLRENGKIDYTKLNSSLSE